MEELALGEEECLDPEEVAVFVLEEECSAVFVSEAFNPFALKLRALFGEG